MSSHRLSGQKRILLVGELGQLSSMNIGAMLRKHGYNVVDELGIRILGQDVAKLNRSVADSIDSTRRFIALNHVDEVFLVFDDLQGHVIDIIAQGMKVVPVPVRLLFDRHMNALLSKPIIDLGPIHAVRLQEGPLSGYQQGLKRAFDIIGSVLGLVLFAPVFVLIGVAIRLDSPGPVIFRQRRAGFSGRIFKIYKFRTMAVMDDGEVVRQATRGDPRVTRVGRFLRRTSLDEIPQLLNVLGGEMSLVGPRPHALSHDDQYQKLISTYALRNHMKPGITGWAQINGFRGETAKLIMMERRVEHDLHYIERWSFALDLWIVGMTALRVVWPRNVY
jgi:Undecaprenyl-phosphate glucose phosphotransferase